MAREDEYDYLFKGEFCLNKQQKIMIKRYIFSILFSGAYR
jgi:hypothetical protein